MMRKSEQRHKAAALVKSLSTDGSRRRVAVLYARCSTEEQAANLSIGTQIDQCSERALAELYEILPASSCAPAYADEGVSSRVSVRPMLEAALHECRVYAKQGHDVAFVCYSLSRVARNVIELRRIADEFESLGVTLISCKERLDTSTAAGRMFFGILGVMYEFERDLVSERTIEAMAHARETGKITGPEPYGYRKRADGSLMLVPEEQAILLTIMRLRAEGWGTTKIANHLNNNDVPSKGRRGPSRWHAGTIQRIVLRVDYEGGPAGRVALPAKR